jgi:hypothetical protein
MAKKKTTQEIIAQDFPGWKVVKEATTRPSVDAAAFSDTATPPLEEIAAKLGDSKTKKTVAKKAVKKAVKKKVDHAKFVTIAPTSQPDARSRQKVVVIRDGKVVAKQG